MKVSVIIPTYNRTSILPRTLDSILEQSFKDWECIVVDDHSTEDVRTVVEAYSTKDQRFKYLLNSRTKGAQGARNTGLYASNAEWIFFFDSDNGMYPELLENLISEAGPEVDVCKCFSNIVDIATGELIGVQDWISEGSIHEDLFDGNTYVDYNQEIIRREKLIEIGGLDENCPSLQEFDTNIRLSVNSIYHTVRKPLVAYYVGGKDTISANYRKQVKGKLYNLIKFKKEWLRDKRNADRFIYELVQKLKMVDSWCFKIKYAIKLIVGVPQMIPYYCRKKCSR